MKKFLEDLENELKKRNIDSAEIAEILADHKEMIENGKADGLEESEMNKKFGNPENIAKEIFNDSKEIAKYSGSFENSNDCTNTIEEDGYNEFIVFNIEEIKEIMVNLVIDDVIIKTHVENKIIILKKDIKDIDKYTASFENNKFELRSDKIKKIFTLSRHGGSFIIKIPEMALLSEYKVTNVSGEITIDSINTNDLKLKTVSGDFVLSNVKANTINFTTVSGDGKIDNIKTKSVNINLVSGDLEFSKAIIEKDIDINTVSGDISASQGECDNLKIKTISGDFKGNDFYPKTIKYGSISGDITIDNNDKNKQIIIERNKSVSGKVHIL